MLSLHKRSYQEKVKDVWVSCQKVNLIDDLDRSQNPVSRYFLFWVQNMFYLFYVISIHILCAHKGRKNHLENLHKNLNKYMRSSYICDPPGQEEMYFIDL